MSHKKKTSRRKKPADVESAPTNANMASLIAIAGSHGLMDVDCPGTLFPNMEESPVGAIGGGTKQSAPSTAAVMSTRWRRFCEINERDLGIPADMTAVNMVGAIAGLNAGHVTGDKNGADVPANLFVLVSAPTGGNKSRCHKLVTKPLFDAQKEAIDDAQNEWERVTRPHIIECEEEIREARREYRKDLDDRSIAERIAALEAAKTGFQRLCPERERYILDDCTVPSRNRAVLRANRNAVFQTSAEARPHLMALLGGSGSGRESEIHFYLTGFSGEPLSLDRVTGNVAATVDAAILSVLFGVQNDLAALFFADPTLAKSGLLARILGFSFGRPPAGRVSLGSPEANAALEDWCRHMAAWAAFKKANARSGPLRVPFSPDAIRLLQNLEPLFPESVSTGNPLLASYNARQLEQVARVALNMAMLDDVGKDVISVDDFDVAAANVFVRRAANDAVAMAGHAGQDATQKMADRLIRFLRKNGGALHLTHGNPSGLSVKTLHELTASFPDRFEIVPVRNGGRGQPQKHIRLRDQKP